jgi:hypothetical protein
MKSKKKISTISFFSSKKKTTNFPTKKQIKIKCVYSNNNSKKTKESKLLNTKKSIKSIDTFQFSKLNNINNEFSLSKSTSIKTVKPKILNVVLFKDNNNQSSKQINDVDKNNQSIKQLNNLDIEDNTSNFLNFDLGNNLNFAIEEEEEKNFENLLNEIDYKKKENKEIELNLSSLKLNNEKNFNEEENEFMNLETLDRSKNSSFYLSNIEEFNVNEKINKVRNFFS